MKSKKEEGKFITQFTLSVIALSLIVLGVDGCPAVGPGIGVGVAGKTGIDWSLEAGVGNFVQGKTINVGDDFYVKLNVLNYDNEAKVITICLKDNLPDIYGGLPAGDGDCQTKNLDAAQIIQGTGTRAATSQPSSTSVYFGPYSYHDLTSDVTQTKLFIKAKYAESSTITSDVRVPTPETETLSLQQTPAVIKANAVKTIHLQQEAYKIDMSITFSKTPGIKIFYPTFSLENENKSGFIISMTPLQISCKDSKGPIPGILNFESKNEKLISCSALAYLATQEQIVYPLIIRLNYAVEDSREYSFTIKATI